MDLYNTVEAECVLIKGVSSFQVSLHNVEGFHCTNTVFELCSDCQCHPYTMYHGVIFLLYLEL